MYSYNYEYAMPTDGSAAAAAVLGVVWGVVLLIGLGIAVAGYVMHSIALHSIAKRRGIAKPWLAWIPIGTEWIMGSLSDQYQYLVKGQVKSRRKVLLGLSIGSMAGGVLAVIMSIAMVVRLALSSGMASDTAMMTRLGETVLGLLGVMLLWLVVAIVQMVFRYMALYDVYRSCDPKNAVAFLVVGIVGGVVLQVIGLPGALLEPIFLLVVHKKDEGMPPRRDPAAPAKVQPEEVLCIHDAEPECPPTQSPVEEPSQHDNPEPWEI